MSEQRLGIDCQGSEIYVVRVDDDGARPVVRSFERYETIPGAFNESPYCIRSISDRDVIVKSLNITTDQPLSTDECARFELAASLLDPEQSFSFDLIETARPNRIVGLAYRKSTDSSSGSRSAGRMRAAALGMGYLAYGRVEPGDLLCLADIGGDAVSICFVYQRKIIHLTHLALSDTKMESERLWKNLAVELKTVVNFKLAELADIGVTVPLAKLVLSGRGDESTRELFARLFPSGVAGVRLNEAYFAPDLRNNEVSVGRYVAALGLTVKSPLASEAG